MLLVLSTAVKKLAQGQNCIKIISDKSHSAPLFLRIQTDILHRGLVSCIKLAYVYQLRQFYTSILPD